MRTIIKNGLLLRSQGCSYADVIFEQEHILEVGQNLPTSGCEVVDAHGLLVMPGGVDVHTHVGLTNGHVTVSDGFFAGTRAAIYGGTTTIVEHISDGPDGCALNYMLDAFRTLAADEAVADYGLHAVLQHVDESIVAEVPKIILDGYPTFKAYLTYDTRLSDAAVLRIMDALRVHGGLLTVHAENHAIIEFLSGKLKTEGCITPLAHPRSRPDFCEGEAVERLINLARAARAGLYIVHLSTARGLAAIERAQAEGMPVFAETCPQYLVLDDSCYAKTGGIDENGDGGDDGLKFVMAPPLRTPQDAAALWEGLKRGSVCAVGTDHCSFSLAQKRRYGGSNVFAAPGGVPGIETRVPVLYSEGVRTGRLSLERFVDVVSTAPAKVMGLARKGVLEAGFDADVVLLDPAAEREVSVASLHQQTDFTPFEGLTVTGWPQQVWLRGQKVLDGGEFTGVKGMGKFQRRALSGC